MFPIVSVVLCLFLFAMSLVMFSKSAEQRARSRTELFYAEQIREETETIRLQNEEKKLEVFTMERAWGNAGKKNDSVLLVDHHIKPIEVTQSPIQEIELKELELDERALDFVNQFKPKQEEIKLQEVTVYEEPTAWFNFPEVDLHMNERPEKGLYYVAAKVIDVLDEMSAIISDGTGERMLYHHKVQTLSIGDIMICQVEIRKGVWNFINVWEINETAQSHTEKAM